MLTNQSKKIEIAVKYEFLKVYTNKSQYYQNSEPRMKPSRHKQLPANHSQDQALGQYNSCKHISRKPSIKQQSHLPMSSNYTISVKKQSKNQFIYKSCSKQPNQKIKSSPYIHLPSIQKEQNNQNVNYSNVSDNNYFYEEKDSRNERSSPGSIYEQFRLDERLKRPFETEESQFSSYCCGDQINDYQRRQSNKNGKNQLETRTKQPQQTYYSTKQQPPIQITHQSSSHSKCSHKSPNFTKKSPQNNQHQHQQQQYYSVNHPNTHQERSPLHTINKSQQLIKKHINQKLDRMCEKIENLSREKDQRNVNGKRYRQEEYRLEKGVNISWNKNSMSNDKNLCYSSIVYNNNNHNDQLTHTPKSINNNNNHHQHNHQIHLPQNHHIPHQIHQDNRIQHRILSPPKPTHQQFLQSHIIQMDKKILFANAKILKLQEQLLEQRQKLIKKQKQWLLRENQLLNWIQANQVQGELVDQNNPSPKRRNHSLKQSHIITANNILVDDGKENYHKLHLELQQYKNICNGLSQLITQMTKVFKINHHWLTLMNRTLSHELPGTAFRVKQQMNLNHNLFTQLQKLCLAKLNDLQKINSNSLITPKPSIGSNLSNFSANGLSSLESPFLNNPSLSQSEVFLLQSYCPPVSQQFQIQTTKRNTSSIKPCQNQRKSLSCLSQSKSVRSTNKKHPSSISTHKKSLKKQSKPTQPPKPHQKPNHSLYHSRKSQYYCDQVFYSRANEINLKSPEQNQLKPPSEHVDNQLYYLLSLQALTIETLIPQNQSVQSTVDHENEENLLSGMDS